MKFFIFTGILHPDFSKMESFRENCKKGWTLGIFLIYSVSLLLFFHGAILDLIIRESQFLVAFYHFFLVFCILWALMSTLLLKKFDALFWKLVNEAESICKNQLGIKTNNKDFTKRCWFKIITSLSVFVLCQSTVFVSAISRNNEGGRNVAIITTAPGIFLRIFWIKFDFYVEVLNFCLKNIKVKLSKKFISKQEMNYLRKSYTLCWKMSRVIEKIFGPGAFLATFYTILGSLYAGHNLCTDYANDYPNSSPFFYVASNVFGMILTALTCQICIDCSSSLAPLVFMKSSKEFNQLIKGFGLQILHQSIKFKPMDLFDINHEFLMEVSKNTESCTKLCDFNEIFNPYSFHRQSQQLFSTMLH